MTDLQWRWFVLKTWLAAHWGWLAIVGFALLWAGILWIGSRARR